MHSFLLFAAISVAELADLISGENEPPGTPFDVTAAISYLRQSDRSVTEIGLEDESGAAVIYALQSGGKAFPSMTVGDIVRASGTIKRSSDSGSIANCNSIATLGHGEKIPPVHTSIRKLLDGNLDYRFAAVRGEVRDVVASELNPTWAFLTLTDGADTLIVSVPKHTGDDSQPGGLIGASVEIEGICVKYEMSPRFRLGRSFKTAGMAAIRTLTPSPANLFDAPDIASIGYRQPTEIAGLGRHRATGSVLARWKPSGALMKTDRGEVVGLDFADIEPPGRGDRIEAVGFPEPDAYRINLARVRYRKLGGPASVATDEDSVTISDVFSRRNGKFRMNGGLNGRTLRCRGTVKNAPRHVDESRALIICDDGTSVALDVSSSPDALAKLEEGAVVEAYGVLVFESEIWRPYAILPRIKGFFLAIPNADGIRTVSAPPWWTPAKFLGAAVAFVVVIVLCLLWNASLRFIVRRRGRQLFAKEIENAAAKLKVMERTRLAVELHDSIAQTLTGIAMEIEAGNHDYAAKALKSCRQELRNCLWDLRGDALEASDMTTAIRSSLKPHEGKAAISVRFNVPRLKISDNTVHDIIRIVRELTLNAISHGNASTVRIAGTVDDGRLLFSVTDNGRGFDPAAAPGIDRGHFGLDGIRERVRRHNGTFKIESSSKTTCATITLPL